MIKKIDPMAISMILIVGKPKLKKEVIEAFKKFPEYSNGVAVSLKDVEEKVDSLFVVAEEAIAELIGKLPEVEVQPEPEANKVVEELGRYHGRYNGDRPTWYFSKKMRDYPATFTITIDGWGELRVTRNDGVRFEERGVIVKQSDVSSRGMAVVAPASCKARVCRFST